MKKILLVLVAVMLLATPMLLLAEEGGGEGNGENGVGDIPDINPIAALKTIIQYAFYVLMILAVFFLIIAGFMFVTARGNEEQIKKARTMLTYAVIGVVVAILAQGAITFIESILRTAGD